MMGRGEDLDAFLPMVWLYFNFFKTCTHIHAQNPHLNNLMSSGNEEEVGYRAVLVAGQIIPGLTLNQRFMFGKPSFSTHAPSWTAGESGSSVVLLARWLI